MKDPPGLPDFAQISVTDAAGKTVLKQTEAFCPNNAWGGSGPTHRRNRSIRRAVR
ncbi:hypothetical protein SBADM41S_05492 [Streptomyces badius]